MNKSDDIKDLAAALSKAQGEMKAAKKDSQNPFFKSNYADLSTIVETARKPLADNGLAVAQVIDYAESGPFVETVLMHSSGQWLSGRYPVKPLKDDPQGRGSAETYARRYSFAAIVGVVTTSDDDDGEAAHGRQPHPIEQNNGGPAPLKADPAAAAKKWAAEAEKTVKAIVEHQALLAWEDANKNALVKLHSVDIKAHEKLLAIISKQHDLTGSIAA